MKWIKINYEVIESAVVERVEGETPLIGENGVTRGVNEDGVIPESLTQVEGTRTHLECDVVYEHRWFLRTSRAHCTRFPNTTCSLPHIVTHTV